MPSDIPMSTFYVAHKNAPQSRTKVKARGPVSARCAMLRLKGHAVTIAHSTGQPLYQGTPAQQKRAQLYYAGLLLWAPTRKGRNPPIIPVE